jgi:hypothetical protein
MSLFPSRSGRLTESRAFEMPFNTYILIYLLDGIMLVALPRNQMYYSLVNYTYLKQWEAIRSISHVTMFHITSPKRVSLSRLGGKFSRLKS